MSSTRPGKLIVDPKKFVPTIKENIRRTLDNYYGITVSHWRSGDDRNLYYDRVASGDTRQIQEGIEPKEYVKLGDHLLHIAPNDYDDLVNRSVHVEALIPIECLLDPQTSWLRGDEVGITLDLEDYEFVKWFEISRIRANNHAGLTLFKFGDIVPVRSDRRTRIP